MTRLLNTGFSELKKTSRARIARPLPIRLFSPPPIPIPRDGVRPTRKTLAPEAPVPRPAPHRPGVPSGTVAAAIAGQPAPDAPIPRLDDRSPAAVIATSSDTLAGRYSVQIGAYHSKSRANARLTQVLDRLQGNYGEAEPAIIQSRSRTSRMVYRARLIGYDGRDDANAACAWLKARQTECLVVRHDS